MMKSSTIPMLFATSLRPGNDIFRVTRRKKSLDSLTPTIEKKRSGVPPFVGNRKANFISMRSTDKHEFDGKSSEPTKQSGSTTFLSVALFLTYLTVMGAKCALPSTLSSISTPESGLDHYSTSLSRQDVISRLLALSTLSIAIGKLALGPVIDSIGGMRSLQIALSTLFICLGLIGLGPGTCPTLTFLAGYWIVVDFAFSCCWAAALKTIRDHMKENTWSKEIGRLAMAARMGNAISFAFFAWLLSWATGHGRFATGVGLEPAQDGIDTSWRLVYLSSSAVQLVPLALLYMFKKKSIVGNGGQNTAKLNSEAPTPIIRSLMILSRESRRLEFWLHLLSRTLIMVMISFLLFIPTYMNQCFGMSSASSARVGSFFAMGCLASVTTLSEKVFPPSSTTFTYKRKSWAVLCFLGISTICLSVQFAFLQDLIPLSPMTGALSMFVWGFSLAIPFYIPASMFALKRGGEEGSATIADAFDVCGFGLLAVFNSCVARVLNTSGQNGILVNRKAPWSPIFLWMLIGSAVSMVSMFFAVRIEGRRNETIESTL
ncbi:hypothetical protein HJC23_005318 [Cyclotella cryptica]|uniref:MFS general substrate transporter n=1 Tax=Cyclotella cryptica TaxID=29204 RepID=A0ABD3PBN2_9STRA|eukprot:CCRYP_016979-RA/>CCRYP_016979-RA protein AED:0.18 eAED:0.22 QI:0/-1/0/1/-1/1/1/0/544